MSGGFQPASASRSTATGVSGFGEADGPRVADAGGAVVSEDGADCQRFFVGLAELAPLRALKLYRLRVDLSTAVPSLPCLDHEAMLHEGIAPHAAAYVEDLETGELHEIVLTPSRRRVEIDIASTVDEHTADGQERLLDRLRERLPDFTYAVNDLSWLQGDRRVARACRAQVTLRDVLLCDDFDGLARALDRLRTIGALMEKQSRVASWTVRTVTGPFLAAVGFVVFLGLGELAPEIGGRIVTVLQGLVVGTAGSLFLYFGLKAVHLTAMANKVWKRAAEYGLIVAERQRLMTRVPRDSSDLLQVTSALGRLEQGHEQHEIDGVRCETEHAVDAGDEQQGVGEIEAQQHGDAADSDQGEANHRLVQTTGHSDHGQQHVEQLSEHGVGDAEDLRPTREDDRGAGALAHPTDGRNPAGVRGDPPVGHAGEIARDAEADEA